MKKPKFIPEFKDIPTKRAKMPELSLEERRLNFKEVELGLTEEMAVAEAKRCLSCRRCIGCGLCLAECDQKAIVYDESPATIQLQVGAVILAPGFDEFDANRKSEFGYGRSFNVITSIEFERILSPTGPYGGVVMRPFDGEIPRRIAFVQCVGSREEGIGANYCSNVCCTYALKEAIVAHERIEGLSVTFFHRDIRPLTKGSEEYYRKAKDDLGVEFVRADVTDIKENKESGTVTIAYSDNGTSLSEEFDLVVLSVGLQAPSTARSLSRRTRIKLNKYNFCLVNPFAPLNTSREGVYVAGAFCGPKDISESIAQASGAAGKVAALSPKGIVPPQQEEQGAKPLKNEKAMIGVFLCQYGAQTQGNIDLGALKTHSQKLPDVTCVGETLYGCLPFGREEITKAVREAGVNKIVIVPCYSKSHQQQFEEMAQEVGLASDEVTIVDFDKDSMNIELAKEEITKAVERVRTGEARRKEHPSTVPTVLVLGGGLAGMTAALDVAEQGFDVHLVDKSERLGGNIQGLKYHLGEEDPIEQAKTLVEKVEAHEKIHVHTKSLLKEFEGEIGHFKTVISSDGKDVTVDHGVLIVATGADLSTPKDHLYGKDKRIVTQIELETLLSPLSSDISHLASVVMIQCVGSRNKEHPYCSRICCAEAIKNTLKIKEIAPQAQVTILHRDMRAYGFEEDFLTEAEESGVQFIRMDGPPEVSDKDGLTVSVADRSTKKLVALKADIVVLSTGIVPSEGNPELAQLLGVPLDSNGFFKEADSKLRPVETDRDGIFICGLAHSPQSISETLSQASAAAGKAGLILSSH
ncbi:MAG: FAD-dependent oxidoreductase [bacterium]